MSAKQWTGVAGAGLAVGALVLGAVGLSAVGTNDTPGDRPDEGRAGQQIRTDARPSSVPDVSGVVRASEPDVPCLDDATPVLEPGTDQRIVDVLRSNWASQADPPSEPMTRTKAIDAARLFSTRAQEVGAADLLPDSASMPAAAARVSYRAADAWIGGDESELPLVAPQRCVWVVTVHAPYVPRFHPPTTKVGAYPSYTVMFDARSGQYLALSAGADGADLITGGRLNAR